MGYLRAAADLSFWGLGILDKDRTTNITSFQIHFSFWGLGYDEINYFEKE